jgi:hypothetical protein
MVQEQVEQLVNAIGDIADNGVELQFIKTALREGNEIQNSISVLLKNNIAGMIDYKDPGTDRQFLQNFDQAISYLNLPLEYAN